MKKDDFDEEIRRMMEKYKKADWRHVFSTWHVVFMFCHAFFFFGAFLQEAEEDMKSCFAFAEKDSGNGGGKTDKPESGKRVTSGSRKRVGEKVADTGSRKAPRMDEEKKGPTPRKLFEEDEEEEDPRASSDKDDDDDDAEDVPTPPGLAPMTLTRICFMVVLLRLARRRGALLRRRGRRIRTRRGTRDRRSLSLLRGSLTQSRLRRIGLRKNPTRACLTASSCS